MWRFTLLAVLAFTVLVPPAYASTTPPVVTIDAALLSNGSWPRFYGTGSDRRPVTVHVFRGDTIEGPEVATLTVQDKHHQWTAAFELPREGAYTAYATEPGHGRRAVEGRSRPVTVEIVLA